MAKIEYSAECLCGGKIVTTFKKPTRMQPSIARARCGECRSEFMFIYSIEYSDGVRAYVPEHEVLYMTPKLKKIYQAKKKQIKELEA